MQIAGYKDSYCIDVVKCLKRNYDWMHNMSDSDVADWMTPIISYKWSHEFDIEQYPYKYGMVLINDNNDVVGYMGLIYSKQILDGKERIVVNPTTWAIDEEYRFELFKCINIMNETADIVVDYTARKSMNEVFTKLFKYKCIDSLGCFFLPLPYFGKRTVKVNKIKNSSQIFSDYIKKIFEYHKDYNVFCAEVELNDRKEYIIYKKHKRATVIKKILPLDGIYVLFVSDNTFIGKYAKEIIWKLQATERAVLITDSRFFIINVEQWKRIKTFPINRLALGTDSLKELPSLAFSEFAILLDEYY